MIPLWVFAAAGAVLLAAAGFWFAWMTVRALVGVVLHEEAERELIETRSP